MSKLIHKMVQEMIFDKWRDGCPCLDAERSTESHSDQNGSLEDATGKNVPIIVMVEGLWKTRY